MRQDDKVVATSQVTTRQRGSPVQDSLHIETSLGLISRARACYGSSPPMAVASRRIFLRGGSRCSAGRSAVTSAAALRASRLRSRVDRDARLAAAPVAAQTPAAARLPSEAGEDEAKPPAGGFRDESRRRGREPPIEQEVLLHFPSGSVAIPATGSCCCSPSASRGARCHLPLTGVKDARAARTSVLYVLCSAQKTIRGRLAVRGGRRAGLCAYGLRRPKEPLASRRIFFLARRRGGRLKLFLLRNFS